MRRLLAPALLAAALTGCGATGGGDDGVDVDAFQGEERRVAQTLDDLSEAARQRDGGDVCRALLARRLVQRLDAGSGSCATALDEQLADVDDADLEIEDLSVSGARATARVTSQVDGEDRVQELTLVREGQAWKLAGLAG